MRPITVLACFWRLWGSAYVQSPSVQAWVDSLPSEVVAGRGADAQIAASEIFGSFSSLGYVASLDYSKAYDTMSAVATGRLLCRGGWPQGLCRVIERMWGTQLRWLEWQGHVDSSPLHASACVPQGCPFGPVAMFAWMGAGCNYVRPVDSSGITWVYLDDRSFTASTAVGLIGKIQAWADFSASVGLRESPGKIQLSGGSSQHRRSLIAASSYPERVSPDFCILGCSSATSNRKMSSKEVERIDKAKRSVLLLGACRLPFNFLLLALRTHGLSKMLYGWVSRLPTWGSMWQLWASFRVAQRVMFAANRHLRSILYGGLLHPFCVIGVRLSSLVHRLRSRGLVWVDRPSRGSVLFTLNSWFKECGSSVVGPWQWSCGPLQTLVDLTSDSLMLVLHRVRETWRLSQWRAFLRSNRHETAELRSFPEESLLAIKWDEVRPWMSESAAMRSVACGAVLSPAACAVAGAGFDPICLWEGCRVSPASFHHLVWDCPHRPVKLTPKNVVDKRFGWFSASSLRWIAKVQETLWAAPH